jgi:Flp pilus assembly protein TadB
MTEQELKEHEMKKTKAENEEAKQKESGAVRKTLESVGRGLKATARVSSGLGAELARVGVLTAVGYIVVAGCMMLTGLTFFQSLFALIGVAVVGQYIHDGLSGKTWNPLTQNGIETPSFFSKEEALQKQAA